MTEYDRAQRAADRILSATALRPRVAVVLGSGLSGFSQALTGEVRIPYQDIPEFPPPTTPGHVGTLVIGQLEDVPLAVLEGRVHLYEGRSAAEVARPVRALGLAGVKSLAVTCACGGLRAEHAAGALVLLRDHINLQGTSPLLGAHHERFGPRFPDMSEAYSAGYRALAVAEGKRLGIELHEAVYAAVLGPGYETPAEIRALAALGADVVGMSVACEVIAARQMDMEVLALGCVTNAAAGLAAAPLRHEDVLRVAARAQERLSALLAALLPRLAR
jgi:purine-nucleoside phosphorylase